MLSFHLHKESSGEFWKLINSTLRHKANAEHMPDQCNGSTYVVTHMVQHFTHNGTNTLETIKKSESWGVAYLDRVELGGTTL